jgi:hypothetical protein
LKTLRDDDDDGDGDHVDGAELRLQTAATHGPISHSPRDNVSMENHGGMMLTGENPDSSNTDLF